MMKISLPSPRILWIALAVLYALFFGWYTSFGGPLTQEEIQRYGKVLDSLSTSPERRAAWQQFMESDTGDDFVIINVIEMRDKPLPGPDISPDATSEEVLNQYTDPFFGLAVRHATHPVAAGQATAGALDHWGLDNSSQWNGGALIRYRSRRDVMEIVLAAQKLDVHRFKEAAINKTIAYPLDPWFSFGDPRLLLMLLLGVLGLSYQLLYQKYSPGTGGT